MTVDNGNGRTIAVHTAEIEQLADAVKAQTELLTKIFGDEGTCPQRHEKLNDEIVCLEKKITLVGTQTKWQWGALTGLGGVVGYLFRLFIEHVQKL